jgi:uncharacterized membrane protein
MLSEILLASTGPSQWLAVFGRAHPALLHLPLGILPAIAVLEFGAPLLRREVPQGAVLALSWLLAITSVLAALSGLVLAGEDTGPNETRDLHKVLGLVLAGLCVVLAVLAVRRGRRPFYLKMFRTTLLAALVVMVPAGHLGATMTHGHDFLFGPLHPSKKNGDTADAAANRGTASTDGTGALTEFQRTIAPILERCCTKCHNPDKKKGELLMTTPEGLQAGGENGPVFVPGKPEDSPMMQRCLLPLDDDDHMPPKGKPQPTLAELDALKAWIAAGARFQ